MLDLKDVRENPDAVRRALRRRHADDLLPELERLLELDRSWRESVVASDTLKSEQNRVSKDIAQLKRQKQDASALIKRMGEVAAEIKSHDDAIRAVRADMEAILYILPNIPHETTPDGRTAEDNPVVREWGDKPTFDFEPKAHWDIGAALGILDLERGGKISGSGFPVLKGQGARLQRALVQMMLDIHTAEHDYQEIAPPYIVHRGTMTGTGQLPKFEEELYRLARQGTETNDIEGAESGHPNDLFLIPTAEVPLTNLHADEILNAEQLPIYYTAHTPCFRREAGAAGRDTRGIIRVHQFDKVELVKFTTPETSYEEHERLLADAEKVVQRLELPYRVIALCAGDLGFGAAKCYDIEVWAAGQGRWLEVSSCSNFEAFQARRANIRFRRKPGDKPEFVHTLNGSGLALPRILIALLENNQQEDGTVRVPLKLQGYFHGDAIR